jgi:hypothetical protein
MHGNQPQTTSSSRLTRHLAKAAAAALAVAGSASAEIIYHQYNVLIPANIDGVYVNVETFQTATAGTSVNGWDLNPYGSTSLIFFSNTGGGMAIGTSCPFNGQTFATFAYNDDSCPCSASCGTTTGTAAYSSALNATSSGIPLTQQLIAGQQYHLVIGSYSDTSGAVSGTLVIDGPPPPACLGDLNNDRVVNGADLGQLLDNWGAPGLGDLNNDGIVNGADLGLQLGAWGACP